MEKKRVLIVTQELSPYVGSTPMGDISSELSNHAQKKGMDIRILVPKFGSINERRNRLHEVVRLSGINITVNEEDYPLLIKVSSLPGTRIQVYFLDNEDLFKEKTAFYDDKQNFYKDNAEKMVFFCKGMVEIVKKFGWAPDIIHCHGWMTSLIPLYIKMAYKDEPVFKNAKVVYSVYENSFKESFENQLADLVGIHNAINKEHLAVFKKADDAGMQIGAMSFADAVIKGSGKIDKEIIKELNNNAKDFPVLEYKSEFLEPYHDLYTSLLERN